MIGSRQNLRNKRLSPKIFYSKDLGRLASTKGLRISGPAGKISRLFDLALCYLYFKELMRIEIVLAGLGTEVNGILWSLLEASGFQGKSSEIGDLGDN